MALISTKVPPMPPPADSVKLPHSMERVLDEVAAPGAAYAVPAVILHYHNSQRWLLELLEGWRHAGTDWIKHGTPSRLASTAKSLRDSLAKARGAALMASSVTALRLNYDRLEETWSEIEEAASLLEAAARLKK